MRQDAAALVFINTLVQVADFASYLVKSVAAVACQRPASAEPRMTLIKVVDV